MALMSHGLECRSSGVQCWPWLWTHISYIIAWHNHIPSLSLSIPIVGSRARKEETSVCCTLNSA